jgi:hypothetical protein
MAKLGARAATAVLLSAVSGGALAMPAHAAAQSGLRMFEIPAQPLSTAILAYSRQSGIPVLAPVDLMQGKTAPAVRGRISPAEALDQLLDGSRLRAVSGEQGGVALTKISDARSTFGKGVANGVRLASAEASAPSAPLPGERSMSDTPAAETHDAMSPGQVAEIVVTAQKREERLIKVPISISVLGGDRLDRGTSKGVSEELNRVAGVSAIPNFHGGGTRISIRGVGAGAALYNGANPIGYYLDGVPF